MVLWRLLGHLLKKNICGGGERMLQLSMTLSDSLLSALTVQWVRRRWYPINSEDTIENENCYYGQIDQCSYAQNIAIVCAWQATGAPCVFMINISINRGQPKNDGTHNKLSRIYT